MKPSLFLDTNVLLDHLVPQRRKDPCSAIFEMAGKGVFEVHISTQSIVDMVYTAKRLNVTREQTNKFISWMLNHTNVDSFNAFSLRDAIADEDPDFEDSAQLSLAATAVLHAHPFSGRPSGQDDERLTDKTCGRTMSCTIRPQKYLETFILESLSRPRCGRTGRTSFRTSTESRPFRRRQAASRRQGGIHPYSCPSRAAGY